MKTFLGMGFVSVLLIGVLFSQPLLAQTAQEMFNRGMKFRRMGDLESAMHWFKRAVELANQNGQVHHSSHFQLAELYEQEQNYPQAISNYESYLRQPDENQQKALYNLVQLYFVLGTLYRSLFYMAVNISDDYYTYELELRALDEKRSIPISLPYLRYLRGRCKYLFGEYDQALGDLQQVQAGNPVYELALIQIAACYDRQGKKRKADELFRQVKQKFSREKESPQSAALRSELWRTYLELKRAKPIEGLQACQKALQICERAVRTTQEEDSEAARLLARVKRNLSYAHYVQGEIDQALAILGTLDFKQPDFLIRPDALYDDLIVKIPYYDLRGFHQKSLIYFQKCRNTVNQLVKLNAQRPADGALMLTGALCQLYTNQILAAIQSFEQLQKETTEAWIRAKATIFLGVAFYMSSQKKKAEAIWVKLLENSPHDQDIFSEMAYQWSILGRNRGLQLYEAVGVKLPSALKTYDRTQHPELMKQLAYVYLQAGIAEGETRENRILYLEQATDCFNKHRREMDEPSLAIRFAEVYYHRRIFPSQAEILLNLFRDYPEVASIFETTRLISSIAKNYPSGVTPLPKWNRLNYPNF